MCMYTFYETNQVRSFIVNIIAMNEKIYDYMWKKKLFKQYDHFNSIFGIQ